MKRIINSNRTQKWIKRNDLIYENTRQRISSYCDQLNIEYYIKESNRSLTLCIKEDEGYYELYFDKDELVLKTIYVNEGKRRLISEYYKNDCWYKAIDKVVNMLYIN